jgi:ethanolaminephosphotransferase
LCVEKKKKPKPLFFSAQMVEYIPASKLKNLAKYKYSGVDLSLCCKYILQPYWNWLVQQFPMSMAPNLITLIGFLCICANLATLLWLSPDLTTPLPNWAFFSFALGLWIYQSLDAIDGKQARRTGTSSPLGQLFDHGKHICLHIYLFIVR